MCIARKKSPDEKLMKKENLFYFIFKNSFNILACEYLNLLQLYIVL